jgi:hypothetical protein
MFTFTSCFLRYARPSEAKLEFIRQSYGLDNQQLEFCIAADPTEKDFVEWIARQLGKGVLLLPEDTQKLREALGRFIKIRRNPRFTGEKDISRYAPSDLYQVVEERAEEVSEHEKKKEVLQGIRGAQLVVSQGPIRVYKVTEPEALMTLSSNTS